MHRCVSHKKNKELNKEVLSGFILLANTPTQTFVFVLAKTGKRKYNSLFCYHCGKKVILKTVGKDVQLCVMDTKLSTTAVT